MVKLEGTTAEVVEPKLLCCGNWAICVELGEEVVHLERERDAWPMSDAIF